MPTLAKAKKIVANAKIPDIDLLYISNFVTNEAVRAHVSEFKSKVVPFSFVKFFQDSLENSISNNPLLKKYFKENTNNDITCFIFYLTFRRVVKNVIKDKKHGYCLVLRQATPPDVLSLYLSTNRLSTTLEELKTECDKLCNLAPHFVRNAYELYLNNYQDYLSLAQDKAFLANYKKTGVAVRKQENTETLIGKSTELPQNSNKRVQRLFIPSLALPSDYPKGKNRIHSAYHVSKLTSVSGIVDFLSNNRITNVKYPKSFVELRLEAGKVAPPARSRSWEDFF